MSTSKEKESESLKSSESSDFPRLKLCYVTLTVNCGFMESLYKIASNISERPDREVAILSFKTRYRDIDLYRDRFQTAHDAILSSHISDQTRSEIETQFNRFYEMYYSVQVIYETHFPAMDTETLNKAEVSKIKQVSLPKISLPHFTGVYTEWPNFIAMFDSLIHTSTDLSSVQKMHYLLSILEKEPLSLIRHLELSNTNYLIAYNILKDRYDNKRLIADKHLDIILSLTSINQTQVHTGLRKLVNTLKENTQALSALGFNVESWSFILLHIVLRKLPTELRSKFETNHYTSNNVIPTFENLLNFLESQLRVLEAISGAKTLTTNSNSASGSSRVFAANTTTCICCSGDHALYHCDTFAGMTPAQRKEFVIEHRLCFNCLRPHSVNKCLSTSSCQICHRRHHTKLHTDQSVNHYQSDEVGEESPPAPPVPDISTHSSTFHSSQGGSTMLLGTALVGLQDSNGYIHTVRAMLDSGSQVTIITENLAQKLHLPRSQPTTLTGLGGTQKTNGSIKCSIHSLLDRSKPPLGTTAVVLTRITNSLPSVQVSSHVVEKCRDLVLADGKFSIPGPIDILIGVDLYNDIFDGRKMHLGQALPTAHSSIYGWVLMGKAPTTNVTCNQVTFLSTWDSNLNSTLAKFWEVEELPQVIEQDPENLLCEKHFVETHSRDESGRFIVRLPFKPVRKTLGTTHMNALKRFNNLEKKLHRNAKLNEMYTDFMADYLQSGHMRPISSALSSGRYYIPHHGVLKESSSTTKLRAVFDASSPSSSGISLNQVLMAGPKLQQNIEDIILRFRIHPIVYTCDVKQMYRQIRLYDEDCKYQTIFWRDHPEAPIQQFELTTVTYGVSSSAYLAMRVIHELASINETSFPQAAQVLREDTFVDDIISGGDSVESAKILQQQVVAILAQGGFQVRKWASNCDTVIAEYPVEHLETPLRFEESGDNIFKILGIEWNCHLDSFVYRVSQLTPCRTKRDILSNIARIYDPCGYLTPITFFAKHFMQALWLHDLSWDDPLPIELSKQWDAFASSFHLLNLPRIPRYIHSKTPIRCDLMGFSDASEKGYAAVAYLRVLDSSGEVKVHLLLAKSRVAPIKQKLTIPRLELCAATLLARLISHVTGVLGTKINITDTIAWSDSSIVLAWLRTPPHKLQTYEGNRVSQIQGLIPLVSWRYVPSALNPADCASRGVCPPDLVGHPLWWSPDWLLNDPSTWPAFNQPDACDNLPGLKPTAVSAHAVASLNEGIPQGSCFITRYSSLSRLQRILAWSLRFVFNSRNPNSKRTGKLNVRELDDALLTATKLVQREVFAEQLKDLQNNRVLKGPLAKLDPFIDQKELLRVGGRLEHSDLSYNVKHPLLLPSSHHFTNLIIESYHQKYFHVGAVTLINILRQRFWISSARRVVRDKIFQCHRCHRLKAKPLEPFMGNLPPNRVRQARPFLKVGIDFAGPFSIKSSSMRNPRIQKGYLCLFVCFATKAVHLEVTSDLTTDAFMACFHRFVARRGMVSDVYTDCGKNFLGAKRYLDEVAQFLDKNKDSLCDSLVKASVVWHMNPPYAPHMGGLWESNIKSAKQLLKRSIGEQILTFEELTTVFTRIEAVLNSRPLCPISDDTSDVNVLTPAHFLIGEPLITIQEYEFDHTPTSRLKRWQLLQQITQHFWHRWQSEYLHNLQQRSKWTKDIPNLQLGDLVLIKDDHLPPLQWRKGRVSALHPGRDGVVRVVEIFTGASSCLRAVSKICALPKCNNTE